MGYFLNPTELCSAFAVPTSVVDKHIKLASAVHLRVLLWCQRMGNYNVDAVAEALKLDLDAVEDAFMYWHEAGVLAKTDDAPTIEKKPAPKRKTAVLGNVIKPNREEVAKRGLECEEIAFILQEAELRFGRYLRDSEKSTLTWLYDDQGLSASLILMIVGFAVSEGRPNIGFIERTAVEWVNDGVTDIESAEKRLVDMRNRRSAWRVVETAMGLEHRSPSKAELETAEKWVNVWGYGRDIIRLAYETCVDNTSKFSMPYIKKIMSEWHKAGVKTVEDIEKLQKPQKASDKTSDNQYMDFFNTLIKKNEENA
ncbi:MAG: DnaD domain protein [Ruminococcaceae bacterium]|nr:DnaD domain protein [Oscillospiraceae bacterium]